jgi:hypothetical protein
VRTKTNTKTFEEEERELIFCKSHFERAKKKKNGKIEERVLKPQ